MDYQSLKHTFESYSQRKTYFEETFSGILGESAIESLIEAGFLTAPASTKYHGSYEGGLFDHSVNVTAALVDLSHYNSLIWENDSALYVSPIKIGMLHDLCKIDQYTKVEGDKGCYFAWNDEPIIKGHGIKSVLYAQMLGIELNVEEVACITYHMGAFTPEKEWKDYTSAIHKYPNVLWTHQADMIATHILEV